ncbi:MAG: aldehyde dehydrogenase family protein, partial [Nitrospira sp.]|nr:aldehyde dehydrogenase family protein [Nitrospira sp.]
VLHIATKDHLATAIESAEKAFLESRNLPRYRRAEILSSIAAQIRQRKDEITQLIVSEAGKPWQYAAGEVDRAISTFAIASEETKRLSGEAIPMDWTPAGEGYFAISKCFPVGPIAAISPFNFPINLVAHKVAPCLAAGCTMILKPPPQAPLTSLLLGEIIESALSSAKAPAGMVNILPCPVDVAEVMVTDERIKMLSFTGSAKVGWYLKSRAGKKRVLLELGGNAGAIVHDDADLDWAAQRLAVGAFAYAGQVCISVQRIYVHELIYDRFLARFLEAVKGLKVGDPMDSKTVVGPLIDKGSADRVKSWIEEAKGKGAKLLMGGGRKENIIEPTVISNVTPDMKVNCEEVFGPVVTVSSYFDFHEAIQAVNGSVYGLQAGVFTKDIKHVMDAFQNLEVGGVIANDYPTFRVDHMPYGGMKDSGLGREGVKYAMEAMT